MNVLYDANKYEYPVVEYSQIYVPLETDPAVAELDEVEKSKETEN